MDLNQAFKAPEVSEVTVKQHQVKPFLKQL